MVPFVHGLVSSTFASLGRQAFLQARGEAKGSGVAGELYTRFFRQGTWAPGASGLTEASAALWEKTVRFDGPLVCETVAHDDPSAGSAAAKALFRLADGARIETVLVPMATGAGGRGTLCVSSQAGCAMGCAFCETGRGGLVRNLSAAEIVAQVHQARFSLGWNFTSLVFMGMGEPLDNLEGVLGALEVLTDPRGFAFAQERITVCTVGLAAGLEALAARGWKRMGVSLSLNAGTDSLRETLMPVTRTNSLDRIHRVLASTPRRANFVLALNYCLMPGINDGAADAGAVAAFAQGLGRVLVNLIPYNPGTAPLTRAPTEVEVDSFLATLKAAGLEARVRGPKGRSIMAACGQLGSNSP
jgi:23S rRNA (adenine2503-C2)-methyltransferase